MTTYNLSPETREMIRLFTDNLLTRIAAIVGSNEIIAGCEIIDLDPDGVGLAVFPRWIQIRIDDYYATAYYRGGLTVIVGDFVSVMHSREGQRYEVLGPSGSGGSFAHDILGPVHGDAATQAVTRGSLIYGDATPEWNELVHPGAANRGLISDATDVLWSPNPVVQGTGAANQVAYWSGPNTITSGANLTWNAGNGPLTIQTGNAANIGLIVQGEAAQAANLQEWQDSAANILSGVDERGIPFADGDTDVTNYFAGSLAGNAATTGTHNVAIGRASMIAVTTGRFNTALGSATLNALTTGEYNFACGRNALNLSNGSHNTALGYLAMSNATTANFCIAIGSTAGNSITTGHNNTVIGYQSGGGTTGQENTGVGKNTLQFTTTGIGNVAVGSVAGRQITTGRYNIAIGYEAVKTGGLTGWYNIFIGYGTGNASTSAWQNTFVGAEAASTVTTGDANVCLGYRAGSGQITVESNELWIANSNTATPLIYGEFDGVGDGVGLMTYCPAAAAVAFTIRGAVAQTGNLFEVQDVTPTTLFQIRAAGSMDLDITYTTSGTLDTDRMFEIEGVVTSDNPAAARYPRALYAGLTTAGAVNFAVGGDIVGVEGWVNHNVNITVGTGIGVWGQYLATNAGTTTVAYGVRGTAGSAVTATITTLVGVEAELTVAAFTTMTSVNAYYFRGDDSLTGTLTVTNMYGLYLPGITDGSALNYAIYTNDGIVRFGDDVQIDADSKALFLGSSQDMDIFYDGADGYIRTDLVAPSDLLIDCGAQRTVELQTNVWNDINQAAVNLRPGSSPPGFINILAAGNIFGFAFDGNVTTEELHGAAEILHDWEEATDISVHVHWSPVDANAGNVKWQLEYSIADVNGTFPNPTTIAIVDAASGTAWDHLLATFANITMAGMNIGAYILFRIFRDPTDAQDTYNSDAVLHGLGIHYEINTLGSRQMLTK